MPLTKENSIKTVFGGGGHIVLLGAGASKTSSALPMGDADGGEIN